MAMEEAGSQFDYVIVGSGMAGSVLANRLTADGTTTVCVLEAGPADRHPFVLIPGGYIKLVTNPKFTWPFKTEPGAGIAGRRIDTVQGRLIGGSSSVNGFNYVRGQALDFDGWAQHGNRGWGYADVLPYFKRSERRIGTGDPRYRGSDGPLPITDGDWHHPLCEAFIAGAARLGIPRNPDYNGAHQAGVGYYQRWIHKGFRVSAARAFLRPAQQRRNLEVRRNAHVTEILFEDGRALGVRYRRDQQAPEQVVRARREVILSAGAANTPKLLQISGIGPPALLNEIGVPVRLARDGVGENLRDHYSVRLVTRVKDVETINELVRGPRLLREIAKWAFGRPSVLAVSPSVAFGFWVSRDELDAPDIQLLFTPGSLMGSVPGRLDTYPGMTLGFYQQRPNSCGNVRARSADPFDFPAIQPNYLTDERDAQVVLDGVKLMRRLMATPELARFTEREEQPGASVQGDAALLDFARANGSTGYHLCGTCQMGSASDLASVVDDRLRLIGLEGLRIVDASVMPMIPSANTGATTLMIAEKAADLILDRPPPPTQDV